MGFKGDLSTISLADLFQTLSATQKQGTLHVHDGESQKSIYFSASGVHLLSSGRRKLQRLGEILVAAGRITPAQLETALALQKETGSRLGEVLERLNLVTLAETEKYVRGQIEEEIYDLFTWKDARFEFVEGTPSGELTKIEGRATSLTFDVQGLLLEAARRLDEWTLIERAIPPPRRVLVPTGAGDVQRADAVARAILEHIDGAHSIADMEEATLSSRFMICKSVAQLLEAGLVRVMDGDETRVEITRFVSSGNLARAVSLARNLVGAEPDDLDARQQLASALRAMGQTEDAAREYRDLGERCIAENNPEMAAKALGLATECAPEDHGLMRAFVDTLGKAGRAAEALAKGRPLVEALLTEGHTPEAVDAARSLVGIAPRESAAHMLLADALLGGRKKDEALVVLLTAREALPLTEVDQRAAFDARIQQIDPSRVTRPTEVKRLASPPRGRAILIAGVLLVGGGILYWLLGRGAHHDGGNEGSHPGPPVVNPPPQRLDTKELDARRAAAEALEKKGDYEAAARAWQEVAAVATKTHVDDAAQYASDSVRRVNQILKDSVDLLARASTEEEGGRYKEACRLVAQLRADYPLSPAARQSKFPVLITSEPPGAEVSIDGKTVGKTPICVKLVPGEQKEVRLNLAPYPLVQREVNEILGGEFSYRFFRIPRFIALAGAAVEATPVLHDGALILATCRGTLLSLDPVSPIEKWRTTIGEKSSISCAPLPAGDLLIVVSEDKHLYAVRPGEANPRWTFDTKAPLRRAALVLPDGSRVVVGAEDGTVVCVSTAAGEQQWRLPAGAAVTAVPAFWNGLVLVATEGGSLLALDPSDGKLQWRRDGLPPITGRMAVEADHLYAAGSAGQVVAIDLSQRKPAWTVSLVSGVPGGLTLSKERLFLGLADGKVACISTGGSVAWTCAAAHGQVDQPPAATDTTVYAGSEDGSIYAIDVAKGAVLWDYKVGEKVRSGILLGPGLLYFGADNDRVYALDQ